MKKLDWQHYVIVASIIVTTLGPDLVKVANLLGPTGTEIAHVVAVISGIVALLKQFVPAGATAKES